MDKKASTSHRIPTPLDITAAWTSQVAQVSALRRLLDVEQRSLFGRFSRIYRELCVQPRAHRRRLQRTLRTSLARMALLVALGHVPLAQAANIRVTAANPGISADGECSLIEAIINANDDAQTHADCAAGSGVDTIILSGNTYTLTAPFAALNGLPPVTSPITIEGNSAIIERNSAAADFRIMEVSNGGDLTLNDTTVTGGFVSEGAAGGILVSPLYGGDTSVTLNNSTVSGNTGSGIRAQGSPPYPAYGFDANITLNNSTVSRNTGDGIFFGDFEVDSESDLVLNNSTVSGNTDNGIVVNDRGATATVNNSTASDNVTGIYAPGCESLVVNNSTVSGNTGAGVNTYCGVTVNSSNVVGNGSGVYSRFFIEVNSSTISGNSGQGVGCSAYYGGCDLTMTNSTVSGNTTSDNQWGGGVYINGDAFISNSTITGNTADGNGGGIGVWDGDVLLKNSVVSGNRVVAGGVGAEIHVRECGDGCVSNNNVLGHDGLTNAEAFSGGFVPDPNDITATSDGTNPTALDSILDTTLQDNGGPTETHALVPGSPAIDAASPDCPPPDTDQRGVSRPQGSACDIGAFELQPTGRTVDIDIKPGNAVNPINPRSKGKLKVAILTTEDFDANTVDVSTIQFGPDGAQPVKYRLDDVDDDRDWDLVLKFKTRHTGIACGDTEATLTAQTIDGTPITGTDSIKTVGCKKK
jgi:hypothetical protein